MKWFTQNFGYDNINRLTSAGDAGYSRGFSYDSFGNMAVSSGTLLSGVTPSSVGGSNPYNLATNQLLAGTYDANGQMKTLGSPTAVNFTYDAEGRITASQSSSPTAAVTYYYDGEGNRIEKAVTGGTTAAFVHDAFGTLVAEYSSTAITAACAPCYLSYDHLGSVRMVTGLNGTVVARHDYLPYGEEIPGGQFGRSGTDDFGVGANVNQKFTGQERDPEMTPNSDFFNARYFSAAAGSFLRPDPGSAGADLGSPQSWNGYGYVGGNPLNAVDPSGMNLQAPDPGSGVGSDNSDWGISFYNIYSGSLGGHGPLLSGGDSGGGGGGGRTSHATMRFAMFAPPAKSGALTQIAVTMRCAADKANSVSAAALFPQTASPFLKNLLSNDFSTASDLITGPGQRRQGAVTSVQHGALANSVVYGAGTIVTQTGFRVAENGAGTSYAAEEIATRTLAETAAGKLAGAILGTVSEGKLIYDGATYAGSVAACLIGW